jgi:hypothetical protein
VRAEGFVVTESASHEGSEKYRTLPERIKPVDYVESQPASPAKDPEMGRDTKRDFMLRYG